MIIRVVFLAILALLTYYVFVQRRRLPFNIVVLAVLVVAAVAFIIKPEMSDPIAQYLGVGTGADLVTYLIEVGLIFIVVHYYTKFSNLQAQMTKLVREMSLLQYQLNRLSGQQTATTEDDGSDPPSATPT